MKFVTCNSQEDSFFYLKHTCGVNLFLKGVFNIQVLLFSTHLGAFNTPEKH